MSALIEGLDVQSVVRGIESLLHYTWQKNPEVKPLKADNFAVSHTLALEKNFKGFEASNLVPIGQVGVSEQLDVDMPVITVLVDHRIPAVAFVKVLEDVYIAVELVDGEPEWLTNGDATFIDPTEGKTTVH